MYAPREGELSERWNSLPGGAVWSNGYRVDFCPVRGFFAAGASMTVSMLGYASGLTLPAPYSSVSTWIGRVLNEGIPWLFSRECRLERAAILRRLGLQRPGFSQAFSGLQIGQS